MREVKKHVFWKTVRGACNQGPAGRWGAPLMIPQPFAVALSRQLLLESVRSDHPWQRECGRTNNHLSSVKGVAQVWLAYMPAGMATSYKWVDAASAAELKFNCLSVNAQ
eukprot:scaffold276791_cov24-Tisochrysis_lutea.AAC.1